MIEKIYCLYHDSSLTPRERTLTGNHLFPTSSSSISLKRKHHRRVRVYSKEKTRDISPGRTSIELIGKQRRSITISSDEDEIAEVSPEYIHSRSKKKRSMQTRLSSPRKRDE
jgi:hypothetical protein